MRPLFGGFRGRPALDLDAAVGVLLALGALARDVPEVQELDLNPLLLTPSGAVCLDARIRVAPVLSRSAGPRALSRRPG